MIFRSILIIIIIAAIPFLLYKACSLTGRWLKRKFLLKRNYGKWVGWAALIGLVAAIIYGVTFGFEKVRVRHEEYASQDLPKAFDGYRIVQISDLHLGTYSKSHKDVVSHIVDSINRMDADLVVFTGDLQNLVPTEIDEHVKELKGRLRAKDGVISILGNHDYPIYIDADEHTKADNLKKTINVERSLGWRLLLNESKSIRRGNDSIVIAGMENDGDGKHFPQRGDIPKTLKGVGESTFIVMLEHDPSSWRRKILPQSHAQLTLSGHTHAMQFMIGSWSPASFVYKEWGGMYYEGNRAINVSTGAGGFIPFRLGVPNEIVVITLYSAVANS